MNLLETIKGLQEKIDVAKEYNPSVDPNDDISIVMIGATQEDTEDTPVEMAGALKGFSVENYTVPTGKKVIPIKLVANKKSAGTDKDVVVSLRETAVSVIEASLNEGERRLVEDFPFTDHEFEAGKVIKLYFVTLAGAVSLFMDAYFIGLEVPA